METERCGGTGTQRTLFSSLADFSSFGKAVGRHHHRNTRVEKKGSLPLITSTAIHPPTPDHPARESIASHLITSSRITRSFTHRFHSCVSARLGNHHDSRSRSAGPLLTRSPLNRLRLDIVDSTSAVTDPIIGTHSRGYPKDGLEAPTVLRDLACPDFISSRNPHPSTNNQPHIVSPMCINTNTFL